MKTLLTLFVLLFSSSVVAFKCIVDNNFDTQEYIISVSDNKEVNQLGTLDEELGGTNYVFITNGYLLKKSSAFNNELYDLIIFHNSKEGDSNPFRAIFFKNDVNNTWVSNIVIETWKENMPIYIFEDYTRRVLKGNCE